MYSTKQIAFILYNNRSVEGTVFNFLPRYRLDPDRLNELEDMFAWCDRMYRDEQTVMVNGVDLDMTAPDLVVTPKMVSDCAGGVMKAHQRLLDGGPELDWLLSRGIGRDIIGDMRLGSLSHIVKEHPDMLAPLGVSIHPSLRNLLSDDVSEGGILIPLFNGDELWNCTTRRISDVGKLKYTQACPDLDVWGLGAKGEYWVSEGLFDAAAIRSTGRLSASVSSAMWSMPQLIQLMDRAESVNIFADRDRVGLRSAAVMKRFFNMNRLPCRTYVSEHAKDPAEHFLEKKLDWSTVVEIDITPELIGKSPDMTFNFTKYLKNREF